MVMRLARITNHACLRDFPENFCSSTIKEEIDEVMVLTFMQHAELTVFAGKKKTVYGAEETPTLRPRVDLFILRKLEVHPTNNHRSRLKFSTFLESLVY